MSEKDKYGREIYGHTEIPPMDAPFAQWRGRTCAPLPVTPGNTITPNGGNDSRYWHNNCIGGWFPSGEWWLHCGLCRAALEANPGGEA